MKEESNGQKRRVKEEREGMRNKVKFKKEEEREYQLQEVSIGGK